MYISLIMDGTAIADDIDHLLDDEGEIFAAAICTNIHTGKS